MVQGLRTRVTLLCLVVGLVTLGLVAAYLIPDEANAFASRLALVLAGGLAVLVFLGWVLSGVLVRMLERPIGEMVDTARRIGEGEPSTRLQTRGWKELSGLARVLNTTAERAREREMRVARERDRLSTIVDTMADGVIVVDEAKRVTVVNEAALALVGSSKERMVGHSFIGAVHDHEMDALLVESLRQETERSGIVEVDAGKRYLGVTASPVRGGEGGVVVLTDLTEVHQLGTMRRDLVANISHELRTPLASVKMLTESLLDGALDERAMAENFVRKIDAEAERLAQMVNELRDLSVIENVETVFEMQPVDLKDVGVRAAKRLQAQAERAGLELNVDIPATLPQAMGDAERLEQVVVNLLHNAIKFTPSGGRVSVSAAAQNSEVVVSVADTGVGISEEDLSRVFERFYKADKARSGGGIGLGLAIVKHVVQAHHGRVWAESVEGEGTTFRFSLPISSG